MSAQWIGDCQDARDWYGLDVECDHVGHDHPSHLRDLDDEGCSYLLCAPVLEAVEFVIDTRQPIERLAARIYSLNLAMDRVGFSPALSDCRQGRLSAPPSADGAAAEPVGRTALTTGSARLPLVTIRGDVMAWAAAEGFEFWGWVS